MWPHFIATSGLLSPLLLLNDRSQLNLLPSDSLDPQTPGPRNGHAEGRAAFYVKGRTH